MKPLIIGQAPARGNDDKPPFSGKSGRRLAELAGVGRTGDVLPAYFDLMNLISRYPGKGRTGKGDKFDMAAAKMQAGLLYDELERMKPRVVLFMGRSVYKAFGLPPRHYLVAWRWNQHTFILFPHPSGINRWWNSVANYDVAERVLRGVLDGDYDPE